MGLYRGSNTRIMEEKMETTIVGFSMYTKSFYLFFFGANFVTSPGFFPTYAHSNNRPSFTERF